MIQICFPAFMAFFQKLVDMANANKPIFLYSVRSITY